MFPAIMPWPMTLAPTNKAIGHGNHAKKTNLLKEKFTVMIQEVMQDVRIVLLSKSIRFYESKRRKGIEFTVLAYIFLIYRTISSVNNNILWILSLSVLVPH
jgi:hypothetical protein